MPRPNFIELRSELLQSGISPAHVYRALTELDEHFEDLVDARVADGHARIVAETHAIDALGDLGEVSRAMRRQPELRSWAWRHPRLAMLFYPLACVAALPAVPVIAGVQHASQIVRWAICLLVGGFVTALMFLLLQLSITPI
jgi:AcrR family transcriptional regulator